jgi:ribosomal protein L11 methyltransferase
MPKAVERAVAYLQADLEVPRQIYEPVCNFIIENFANGLILDEERDSPKIRIRFYVPAEKTSGFPLQLIRYINAILPGRKFTSEEIKVREIHDSEWLEKYKKSVRPVFVEDIVIRAPWADVEKGHKFELIIEPGMAFGTGNHETTRLCIRQMSRYFRPGMSFFDLGCGSGILSILAAKMGGVGVKGVDTDPVAVREAERNTMINDVGDVVAIKHGSIEKAFFDPSYDFLAANLTGEEITGLYDRIHRIVGEKGIIVLSGLLEEDGDSIDRMLGSYEIAGCEINREGQWLAYTVFKKGSM